jgi:hypothetical protein
MLTLTLALAAAVALPPADVEKIWWDCDYASTQAMAGQSEAALCSLAFEKLKADKFKGDFTAFMTWWKANKEREYKARASTPR